MSNRTQTYTRYTAWMPGVIVDPPGPGADRSPSVFIDAQAEKQAWLYRGQALLIPGGRPDGTFIPQAERRAPMLVVLAPPFKDPGFAKLLPGGRTDGAIPANWQQTVWLRASRALYFHPGSATIFTRALFLTPPPPVTITGGPPLVVLAAPPKPHRGFATLTVGAAHVEVRMVAPKLLLSLAASVKPHKGFQADLHPGQDGRNLKRCYLRSDPVFSPAWKPPGMVWIYRIPPNRFDRPVPGIISPAPWSPTPRLGSVWSSHPNRDPKFPGLTFGIRAEAVHTLQQLHFGSVNFGFDVKTGLPNLHSTRMLMVQARTIAQFLPGEATWLNRLTQRPQTEIAQRMAITLVSTPLASYAWGSARTTARTRLEPIVRPSMLVVVTHHRKPDGSVTLFKSTRSAAPSSGSMLKPLLVPTPYRIPYSGMVRIITRTRDNSIAPVPVFDYAYCVGEPVSGWAVGMAGTGWLVDKPDSGWIFGGPEE